MTAVSLDVDRFRTFIARCFGLLFDDSKLPFLIEVLERCAHQAHQTSGAYLDRLDSPDSLDSSATANERRRLITELTVAETYFFRHTDQFRAVRDVVLSDRSRPRSELRRLSVLSVGCATGEEPYSIAMLVREHLKDTARWQISIRGVDLNEKSVGRARAGRYSKWSLRETPPEIQARWFHAKGEEFILDASIREMVALEERNLVDDDEALWRPQSFDLVFCRNVLMYLVPHVARDLVARIARALSPGGYLFLGHAETLRGLSHDFHLRHTHDTFYYQRRAPGEEEHEDSLSRAGFEPLVPARPASVDESESWVENIRRASERIKALTHASASSNMAQDDAALGRRERPVELGLAIELLREERFSEADTLLRALPAESSRDPDVLLLRAVVLTHGGDLREAERLCNEVLALDELSAGAHYLTALCREDLGDRKAAIDHDQIASYLDPTFAMPRLHRGLLARRAKDLETARRELQEALLLLEREDASRVLLFGGGFTREALVDLCRAEIAAAGGLP